MLRIGRKFRGVRLPHVDLKCEVDEAAPDFSAVDDIFLTLRRLISGDKYGALLEQHRQDMKAEAVEEIERGTALTVADVTRAMTLHGQLLQRMAAFFERYDVIACAVSQVPPFDVTADWPRSVAGVSHEVHAP